MDFWGSQALNRLTGLISTIRVWGHGTERNIQYSQNSQIDKKNISKKKETFKLISNQTIGVTFYDKGTCILNLTHYPTPAQEPGYEANVECIAISYYTNFVFLELKLNLEY